MDGRSIEAFLAVVRTRNITKAAEQMFVSQSVVSERINSLEQELKCRLFTRGKGIREVNLTRQGESFIPIARQWQRLCEASDLLSAQASRSLSVASTESVFFDFLEPVLTDMLSERPDIRLTLQITDSSAIHRLMYDNAIDFGLASYDAKLDGVVHEYLYEQHYCVVCSPDYLPGETELSPSRLDPRRETVFIGGQFRNLELWRDRWFGSHRQGQLALNTPTVAARLLEAVGGWALVPHGAARLLAERQPLRICRLTDPPEAGRIYLLRRADSVGGSEAAAVFLAALEARLKGGRPGG